MGRSGYRKIVDTTTAPNQWTAGKTMNYFSIGRLKFQKRIYSDVESIECAYSSVYLELLSVKVYTWYCKANKELDMGVNRLILV